MVLISPHFFVKFLHRNYEHMAAGPVLILEGFVAPQPLHLLSPLLLPAGHVWLLGIGLLFSL